MPARASKPPKRPRDLNQLAYQIVQETTGQQVLGSSPPDREKNPAAVALGLLGAQKGGLARSKKLSPEKRRKIAQMAAAARWNKKK